MNRKTLFYTLKVAALIFLNIATTKLPAQDTAKKLTIDDAIQMAVRNNKTIQLSKLDEHIAMANYQRTDAIFLPQADFSYSAMISNSPLNALGYKLQQRIVSANDFNPGLLNHPSATRDFIAKLEIQQPLLNLDMLYMRKCAQKQKEVHHYQTQYTQEYVTFEVKKAFLQLLLAYESVKVLTETSQTATAVYTFTDDHFRQGLIQKSDLLNAQVHVITVTNSLENAQSNVRNASDNLSLLMGQRKGIIYKVSDNSIPLQFEMDTSRDISISRGDFVALQKAIDALGLAIKSKEMSYLPKLDAFANYQYNDKQLTAFHASAYMVGVQLSWNIFNGARTKHEIAAQKIEQDKLAVQLALQKEESQVELNKAYRDLSDAQFKIKKEEAAIQQAGEALRILQNRYQQGLVNTTDVLTADTQLSQLKYLLAQDHFTANVTIAYIQLLTTTSTQ